MQIVTVCGLGVGTSLMLKMTIQDILDAEGISADVEAWDAGTVKGRSADLFVVSEDLRSSLEGLDGNVVYIKNITDTDEIREKVLAALR
ncbi:MAG: PTS sugar transporter subunit IIB [Firmicutes bacterium]|nr:PTS sugar transporter subunit IIB [Bacillota bacterium]